MNIAERPILFNAPMVRAILDGSKDQTRRVVRPQPVRSSILENGGWIWNKGTVVLGASDGLFQEEMQRHCPYGKAGDRLWVRETWARHPDEPGIIWRATDPGWDDNDYGIKWRPSIFMPRWASRITLEVTGVRVERVQDISETDAKAEGVDQEFRTVIMSPSGCKDYHMPNSYRGGFANLWDEINARRGYSWESNPWVFAVTFRRVQP